MTKYAYALSPFLAVAALLPMAGCSPTDVILPAYYELRGAKGTIQWIDEPPVGSLDAFSSVYFEPLSNSLGRRLCPPPLVRDYDQTARAYEASLKKYPGGAPTVNVASDVVYFQSKGLLSGALLLVRVKLAADGRQIGDGLLRVESKSFREGDASDLAETAVRTVTKYLSEEKAPSVRQ
jgi:hypothetical protein